MNKLLQYRFINLWIFLFCVALLGIAYYMEHVMFLEPCPLCITQRIFFFLAGLTALIAFIANPKARGRIVFSLSSAAFAIGGGGFALRQIWLQGLPKDQIPACGPSLGYMLEEFPFSEVLQAMLSGDGNCAEKGWVDPILQLSIPQLSLIGFIMLAALCVWQALRKA
jgi:protein dithiol:quinone oxidoreductase